MNSTKQQKLLSWLTLWRTPRLGPKRFHELLQHYPDVKNIFSATITELECFHLNEASLNYFKNPDWASAEQDLRWAQQKNHHIITINQTDYPTLLKEISNPPPLIFAEGDLKLLNTPQLAMVGSRNPSMAGKDNAHAFARHLAQAGLTITSGLALGIDAASHQGALVVQGKTIAVLGTGLDYIYPSSHKKLATEIAEQGLLLSEFPLGSKPHAAHFPQRNRIISGLSLGTLVVEAAISSGSLITATFALEQNREVFAIPSSIHNPLAKGCHALIRQGAKLVETATDIIEEMQNSLQLPHVINNHENPIKTRPELSSEQIIILSTLDFSPCTLDILIYRSGLTAAQVSAILLELELLGYIENRVGSYMRIK